jgi:carboxyl-terminal processing protease
MKRRDGLVEVERAADLPPERRWSGSLAVLVDGDSASAAEMIAGAIASYRRGVVVGDRTYGKGCAQEYLDDEAHAGVLRLTTLLFCLPDGTPVQKTGVSPHIRLTLPGTNERESMVTRALGRRGEGARGALAGARGPRGTVPGRGDLQGAAGGGGGSGGGSLKQELTQSL